MVGHTVAEVPARIELIGHLNIVLGRSEYVVYLYFARRVGCKAGFPEEVERYHLVECFGIVLVGEEIVVAGLCLRMYGRNCH